MKIQTNISANTALGYSSINEANTRKSIERLSSGYRINRAGDDAAGMAISNKLGADIRGLSQAQQNVAQGTSMLQIMDGATQTVSSILDRMKELATQANSANVGNQSSKLNQEFQSLIGEIGQIVGTTKYQGTSLLDGSMGTTVNTDPATSTLLASAKGVSSTALNGAASGTYTFTDTAGSIQVDNGAGVTQTITGATAGKTLTFDKVGVSITLGAGYAAGDASGDLVVTAGSGSASFQVASSGSYAAGGSDMLAIQGVDLRATTLGINTMDLTNQTNAASALTAVDTAIDRVNTALGTIGAGESRMDFAASNVATMLQNTQAARSAVRDTDMAAEMTNFTKNNILSQAAQAMLSQANQGSQGILQLLRG